MVKCEMKNKSLGNNFKLCKKDIMKLKGICESFDGIANIVCPCNYDDPLECQVVINKVQDILQKFGEEFGL